MVSIIPALDRVGIDTFYAGWRPPLLPMDAPLDERRIEESTLEMRECFARIRTRIASGLAPRDLLERAAASE